MARRLALIQGTTYDLDKIDFIQKRLGWEGDQLAYYGIRIVYFNGAEGTEWYTYERDRDSDFNWIFDSLK